MRPIQTPSTIRTAFTPPLRPGKEVLASSARTTFIRTLTAIALSADSMGAKTARVPMTALCARKASLLLLTQCQNSPSASTAMIEVSQRLPRRAPTTTRIARTAWWMTNCASRNVSPALLVSSSQMQPRRRKNASPSAPLGTLGPRYTVPEA